MPSTKETNFLSDNIVLQLNDKQLSINIYDTPLGKRWIEALKDNLKNKRINVFSTILFILIKSIIGSDKIKVKDPLIPNIMNISIR